MCACAPQSVGWSTQHRLQSSARRLGLICPLNMEPPTMSCFKHPHLTSGHQSFPYCCCFSMLLKQRIETCPPAVQGGSSEEHDLMRGISLLFEVPQPSGFMNRRACAEDNAVWSLICCLFLCWKHNARANDFKLKTWSSDFKGPSWKSACVFTVCMPVSCGALPNCALPFKYKHWVNDLTVHSLVCPKKKMNMIDIYCQISDDTKLTHALTHAITCRSSHSSSKTDRLFHIHDFLHQAHLTQRLLAHVHTRAKILD